MNYDLFFFQRTHLVVFAGVSEEVSEEIKAGTFSDQDEVGGAVGQVGGGREAFWRARTSAAHTGGVYGEELPSDCPPLALTLCNDTPEAGLTQFCRQTFTGSQRDASRT